jgi:hypothetical protein
MSIYYTGIYLNKVPTGFGIYTGLSLTNSGNFPVEYTVSISDTNLLNLSSSDSDDGFLPNTIFISDNIDTYESQNQELTKIINPSSSGIIYILHKPFDNFVAGHEATGYEIARVTVGTISSAGGQDTDILIDITGQRVFAQPTPKRVGKFYAVKDYFENTNATYQFNWGVIDLDNYITGFKIQTATDSSFSTIIDTLEYPIEKNNSSDYPLYGGFDALKNDDFRATVQNLQINTNYYSRIQPLNVDGAGPYSYATGFTDYYPILNGTGYSGVVPSPGSNLKLDPTGLYLTKISDNETDFDLFDFLYKANNNSSDFTKYTGVIVKFYPNTQPSAIYRASTTANGAINFIEPNDKQLKFSVDANNIFRMQLEFENVNLYGCGGDGLKWNADGTFTSPKDGGPVFNIDNVAYQDSNGVERKFNYYIYKDVDSIFYAGPAGGKGWLITENTATETTNPIKIEGHKITHLIDYNLVVTIPNP